MPPRGNTDGVLRPPHQCSPISALPSVFSTSLGDKRNRYPVLRLCRRTAERHRRDAHASERGDATRPDTCAYMSVRHWPRLRPRAVHTTTMSHTTPTPHTPQVGTTLDSTMMRSIFPLWTRWPQKVWGSSRITRINTALQHDHRVRHNILTHPPLASSAKRYVLPTCSLK